MEADASRMWVAVAAVAAAALLASSTPVTGYHDGPPPPPFCKAVNDTALPGHYNYARIRSVGYVMGNVEGFAVDEPVERAVDALHRHPDVQPQVFERANGPRIAGDIHVVGEHVKLHYDGVTNNERFLGDDLPGKTPTTVLKERLRATWSTDERVLTGATKLNMIFTGRITVWEPETYECHTSSPDYQERTFEAQKVRLEGVATAPADLDDAQEAFGSALDLDVDKGSTRDR
jgi:hypothetical protein